MSRRALGAFLALALALAGCPGSPAPPAPVPPPAPGAAPSAPATHGPSPWDGWGAGSTVESETVTDTGSPATHATTRIRRTVLERTPTDVALRVEVAVSRGASGDGAGGDGAGVPVRTYETRVPLEGEAAHSAAAPPERVTVPAGTFDARRVHAEADGAVTDEWWAPVIPFPIQSKTVRPGATSTTRIVSFVKK